MKKDWKKEFQIIEEKQIRKKQSIKENNNKKKTILLNEDFASIATSLGKGIGGFVGNLATELTKGTISTIGELGSGIFSGLKSLGNLTSKALSKVGEAKRLSKEDKKNMNILKEMTLNDTELKSIKKVLEGIVDQIIDLPSALIVYINITNEILKKIESMGKTINKQKIKRYKIVFKKAEYIFVYMKKRADKLKDEKEISNSVGNFAKKI